MHAHDDTRHAHGGHGHSHSHGSAHDGALVRLSANLYWYRDTCNVYLLVRGDRGLLIDFGSGGILEHLAEAGVREIEWVLHTHHHRDQCQGDHLLAERGVPIAVPEREVALFAQTDAFWRLKRPTFASSACAPRVISGCIELIAATTSSCDDTIFRKK